MKSIKSPISREVIFQEKLKNLFDEEKVEGCFVFYLTEKEGDAEVFDGGLCGHQLLALAEMIEEEGERRLREDKCEDKK